jgi:hypothetical protein
MRPTRQDENMPGSHPLVRPFEDLPPTQSPTVAREPPSSDSRAASVDARRLVTVEDAAQLLSTTPTALRARCRRHARRVGRETVARLGAGVVAFKFGGSWRLRIEPP